MGAGRFALKAALRLKPGFAKVRVKARAEFFC